MEDGQAQEITDLKEVPRPREHCGKPMRRVIVGTMTREPRYQYICQNGDHQELGEKVDA